MAPDLTLNEPSSIFIPVLYVASNAKLLERPDAGKVIPGGGVYPKNVQENLTPDQLKQLKKIVEEEYHE